jgi:hypothetical protein
MGKSILSILKRVPSVCFFVNKRTKEKIRMHDENGKRMKENRLGLGFPFKTAAYTYRDI